MESAAGKRENQEISDPQNIEIKIKCTVYFLHTLEHKRWLQLTKFSAFMAFTSFIKRSLSERTIALMWY